jgi:hypothetical protein
VEYNPKTQLVLSALLDIAIGTLALYLAFIATDSDVTGPIQTAVTFILAGLAAGVLRGRSGSANPWVKGLFVSGFALVTFASLAFWVAQDWHRAAPPELLGPGRHDAYWRLVSAERLKKELAFTALPLLFILSSIVGTGLCHLLRPAASRVVKSALLDILVGAVFFYIGPVIATYQIKSGWLTIVMLIVAGLAAGFLRGRSGFANPWVKGLLIGAAAILLSAYGLSFTAQYWKSMIGSVSLYDYLHDLWPLLFVLSSIAGAKLRSLQKPSTVNAL